MGEAKRRSKSDPNYGKFFALSSAAAKAKHSELIVDELFTVFDSEFKTLISAKTFPDDYQSICDRLASWFEQKLLQYRRQDRDYIVQFVLGMAAKIGDEFVLEQQFGRHDTISPALFCCLFLATKSYLDDDALVQFQAILKQALKKLNRDDSTQLFAISLLEQTQQ